MRLVALTTTHRADQIGPADLVVPDLTHVTVRTVDRANGGGGRSFMLNIDRKV
jgi:hypothetical protein